MTTESQNSRSRLSNELETLRARTKDQSLTLGELKQALKHRGSAMLLVLLFAAEGFQLLLNSF
jgi:hypothetical protein